MKIAIPVADGKLCMHFGHCEKFALIDIDEVKNVIQGYFGKYRPLESIKEILELFEQLVYNNDLLKEALFSLIDEKEIIYQQKSHRGWINSH